MLVGSAEFNPAKAAAPLLGASRPTVFRFPLGKFEVTTVLDGAAQLDGPFPIFGENQTAEAVAAYATANNLSGSRQEISFTPVIVNTGKEGAAATRKKVLGMAAADRILMTGYHMPFPAVGYVEAMGDGFRWNAASYQMFL
jgi:hypothetical protein